MSAHEYILEVRRKNPHIFTLTVENKVTIKSSEIERIIVKAFETGRSSGFEEGKNSKSVFEQIFG